MKLKITVFTAFIILSFSLITNANGRFSFTKGVLNLQGVDIEACDIIKLEGEVEFYWKQLLEPADFLDTTHQHNCQYVYIPKSWDNYTFKDKKLSREGYCTYRFIIEKKADSKITFYGIKEETIFCSYKLWVNGQLVSQVGSVGKSKDDFKPQFKAQDMLFCLDPEKGATDRVEVIMQISNFSHRRAGMPWAMYFGTFDNIKNYSRNWDILNLIAIGIVLIIGINHLIMYFFRRQDRTNLYFGILSLVMIIRNISTGDRIIEYLFPNISWELLLKLDNFSGYGTIPFFALFIYHQFKEEFHAWIKNAFVIFGVIIAVLIFSTPALVYGKFNQFFELYLLIGGVYLTFGVLLRATILGRRWAFASFIGMIILYGTITNDVLHSMGVVNTPYIAPYGLVVFMLIQSFILSGKSARAINENEDLSKELYNEKQDLEKNIEKRVHELKEQQKILIAHQEKEKEQNWINVGLAKLNDVLTDNKNDSKVLSQVVINTLSKYLDAKLGALYVINEENPAEPYLEMVASYGSGKGMKSKNKKIEPGSGLVGATYSDAQLKILNDIPEDYFKINSGLGESLPKSILFIPLSTDEAVFGVIELARFKEFSKVEVEFVKKIAYSIAINLNNVRMNERSINLLQQFQEQAQEMQEKEELIRESMEELEYYREQFERLKRQGEQGERSEE